MLCVILCAATPKPDPCCRSHQKHSNSPLKSALCRLFPRSASCQASVSHNITVGQSLAVFFVPKRVNLRSGRWVKPRISGIPSALWFLVGFSQCLCTSERLEQFQPLAGMLLRDKDLCLLCNKHQGRLSLRLAPGLSVASLSERWESPSLGCWDIIIFLIKNRGRPWRARGGEASLVHRRMAKSVF